MSYCTGTVRGTCYQSIKKLNQTGQESDAKPDLMRVERNSRTGMAMWTVAEILERLSSTSGSSLYMLSAISRMHAVSATMHTCTHQDLATSLASKQIRGLIYRPSFRENKPKTLVLNDWKWWFWACFRENWVYKFRHRTKEGQNSTSKKETLKNYKSLIIFLEGLRLFRVHVSFSWNVILTTGLENSVFRIRIRDPRWIKIQSQNPGSGMNVPDLILENLVSVFWVKNAWCGSGILLTLDPGFGMEKIRSGILDKHPKIRNTVKNL